MYFEHSPLHANFGMEVVGADVTQPLTDAQVAEIRAAFEKHSLLLFRGPPIDDARQFAFSKYFGEPQISFSGNQTGGTHFSRQSNIDPNTGALLPLDHKQMVYQSGNVMWHSDSSYRQSGSLCSILSAREVTPEGGHTEFISQRAAWDALPVERQQALMGRFAMHSIVHSRNLIAPNLLTEAQEKEIPAARHPLVNVNPVNRRKSLFLGAHASHIEDMTVEEGQALLRELLALATREPEIYSHKWEIGDVIVWDNRCMLHRATPFDATRHRRLLQRTTVPGDTSDHAVL
jgi:alpha-ketoglutarate-dependent 2,4-dichlorophenoxyacetate dioxygenase